MRDQRVGGQSVSQQTLTEPLLFARRWRVRELAQQPDILLSPGRPPSRSTLSQEPQATFRPGCTGPQELGEVLSRS